ncbi:MAG: OsmC family protein [Bacteroidota bacterium]
MVQVIARLDRSKYKTVLTTDRHQIIGDEPAPYGTDEGPSPYDFLLMSLGSCVAMTLRMYADRKKWDLREVEVHLSQQRVHHSDCADCESKEGYVHIIEKKVKLIGQLDEAQKARLMEIADRCPVNKTLLNEIKINTVAL